MKKFEIGKRYEAESGSVSVFEIVKRTAKRVTFVEVQHSGRYNERKGEPKTVAIESWTNGEEVFFTKNGATVIA